MAFKTLEEEFKHIASLNEDGRLEVEECVDYALANRNESLIAAHFPSQKAAARAHYGHVVRGLIRVHWKIERVVSNEPIRFWVARPPAGTAPRGYDRTKDVLSDSDARRALALTQVNQMLAIWRSYKLSELQEVADLLLKLQQELSPETVAMSA